VPRNLAFALTKRQFMDGTKDVTRRVGWRFVKRGEILCGVRKSMGFAKGETIVRLGYIEVVEVWTESLDTMLIDEDYGRAECRREGFPEMTPAEFVAYFCGIHGNWTPAAQVTRIVFKHIPDWPGLPATVWGSRLL
jgi:hypothetical protein